MANKLGLLQCGKRWLDLSETQLMGVLNVTPDSFSDGGRFDQLDAALSQAESMHRAGASIIDVGGESTRPGAEPISVQQELDRVCPVVEALALNSEVVISVDTSSPEVMSQVLALGAGMINDVRAFSRSGALAAVAGENAALAVMHMQGQPETMQHSPQYQDIVIEVGQFLMERLDEMQAQGIARERLVIDPGFGFGKTLAHNLALLDQLPQLVALNYPVLVGLSRKSMIGAILEKTVSDRLYGSVAGAVLAAANGASIIRVHDVPETKDAMKVVDALSRHRNNNMEKAR